MTTRNNTLANCKAVRFLRLKEEPLLKESPIPELDPLCKGCAGESQDASYIYPGGTCPLKEASKMVVGGV